MEERPFETRDNNPDFAWDEGSKVEGGRCEERALSEVENPLAGRPRQAVAKQVQQAS